MSLKDEVERLRARVEEIDVQLAKTAAEQARLREEKKALVADSVELVEYLTVKGKFP